MTDRERIEQLERERDEARQWARILRAAVRTFIYQGMSDYAKQTANAALRATRRLEELER